MRDLILNMTATGSFVEVPNIPKDCLSAAVQARTVADVLVSFGAQATYWTVKADTSRTFIGKFNQGDLRVQATAGVVIEIELSTRGYSL